MDATNSIRTGCDPLHAPGTTTGMVGTLSEKSNGIGAGRFGNLDRSEGRDTEKAEGKRIQAKVKKCKICRDMFHPSKPMQCVCGVKCALSMASLKKAKRERVEKIKDRKETREKLEKLKTRSDWIKEAQIAFNKYIRLRDHGKGCISCGADCSAASVGGVGDAGHFRSRGSAPHLRFDERNCHLQCKRCNRYLSGNVADYRVGLIDRIGLDAVRALECDQAGWDHSIDALKAIKAEYLAKARDLERAKC